MGTDGYVKLEDILNKHQFKGVTVKQIEEVVETNDKKRFELTTKLDENNICFKFIRAT